MSLTRTVNIRTEPYDVYIGRAGRGEDGYFGNPYRLGANMGRELSLRLFEAHFYERLEHDPEFKQRVLALAGKRLGCFCKPQACHGDVIADYVNGEVFGKTHTTRVVGQ
jgi:hypothetical protein